ncbi:ABC transporter substrate-binding protein, partial [Azoarcus communis]
QPYEFGYQSMIKLAKYIEGDKSVVPANKLDIVPTQVVDKSNVGDFAKKIQTLLRK